FRIYLIGEPSSAWNKGAARVFTEWLTINQKIITENEYEIDRIQKAFLSHIRYLHSLHLKSTRSRQAQDAKARRSVVDGRKRGTYNSRARVIKEFAALRKFEQTWNTLGVDGTSSDEEISRGGQRQYIIHNLEWRSQEFTGFCRKLDVLHLSKRKTKVDAYGNITFGRGASPRQRLELGNYTKTKRTPIVGLPINCYDELW
ncbi:hypothetical protein BT96DRAFT_738057, partial [Gymnopus androsaceus JB14]